MVGVISQLASHQGKKQEFVKERALALVNDRNCVEEQTNTACSAVDAIPGRIRWRKERIAEDSEYLKRLEILLADALVKSDSINSIAASIVIQSDPSEISDEQMRSHLFTVINSASNAAPTQSPTKISSPPKSTDQSTPLACSRLNTRVRSSCENCGLLVGKQRTA